MAKEGFAGHFLTKTSDTIVVFDECPAEAFGNPSMDAYREMAKLLKTASNADSLVVSVKNPLVSKMEAVKEDVREILENYECVLFSGVRMFKTLAASKVLTGVDIILPKDAGTPMLLGQQLLDRLTLFQGEFSGATVMGTSLRKTKKQPEGGVRLRVSDLPGLVPQATLDTLLPVVMNILPEGTYMDVDNMVVEQYSPSGTSQDLMFDIHELNLGAKTLRAGFTQLPTYWVNKFYEEYFSIFQRDIDFLRTAKPMPAIECVEVDSLAGLKDALGVRSPEQPLSFDIEATGLFPWEYYDLDNRGGDFFYGKVPYDKHDPAMKKHSIISCHTASSENLGITFLADHPRIQHSTPWLDMLKWFCSTPNPKLIHNAKFEWIWVAMYMGIPIAGKLYDTQIMEHTLYEGMFSASGRYSLAGVIAARLKYIPHKETFQDPLDTNARTKKMASKINVASEDIQELYHTAGVPVCRVRDKDFTLLSREDLIKYGGIDAAILHAVAKDQQREFSKRGMGRAWNTISADLTSRMSRTLGSMEYNGMPMDRDGVMEIIHDCDVLIEKERKNLTETLGSLNFLSNKELGVMIEEDYPELYDNMKRTNTGELQITEKTLDQYKEQYPWLGNLFAMKHAFKVKNTYMLPFLQYSSDGTIHFSFNISGPATGRLSSERPNMQNIPEVVSGIPVKDVLKPLHGQLLVALDIANIEVRMLANCSNDPVLQRVILDGLDFHTYTASRISPYTYEEIYEANSKSKADRTPEDKIKAAWRQIAKPVNFGIVYGITGGGLAAGIGCTPEEGDAMIEKFYLGYPGVAKYLEDVRNQVKNKGFVETHMGRRRTFEVLRRYGRLVPKYIVTRMARKAQNFVIQSPSSDVFQYLMEELTLVKGVTPHITVHDSLLLSLDESVCSLHELNKHFHRILIERPTELWPDIMTVPLAYDLEIGYSYGALHKVKDPEDLEDMVKKGQTGGEWVKSREKSTNTEKPKVPESVFPLAF